MKSNPRILSRAIHCLFIGAALFTASIAIAGPIGLQAVSGDAVYVKEQSVASADVTVLSLPLLQAGGSVRYQSNGVYVGSLNIGVSNSPTGPWSNELAFCVDPWNWSGSTAMPYLSQSLNDLSASSTSTFDIRQLASHKSQIESLYSNYYQGTVGNTRQSAAFQMALWEIVSDNAVQQIYGTNQQIWNDGQAILSDLLNSNFKMGSQRYALTSYTVQRDQPGYEIAGQNYLVASELPEQLTSTVPEPASLGLLGVGLLGLIGLRRKAVAAGV